MRSVIIMLLLGVSACSKLRAVIFEKTGIPIEFNVSTATMKELHLNGLVAPGKYILVWGIVMEAGEGGTFIVIEDEYAKVMVDVTSLEQSLIQSSLGKKVEVLGRFSGGKKGLPLLIASAMREKS